MTHAQKTSLPIEKRRFLKSSAANSEARLLSGLDDAAGAQPVRAQRHEVRSVLEGGDAAGGLDLEVGGDVGLQQGHVRPGWRLHRQTQWRF